MAGELRPFDNARRPTILCIDDDPQISETIAIRLRQYEVDVLRSYHGMHGLWLAMTSEPELIITDLTMPQGGGNYVIECLKNNRETCRIPIIVLTGRRDPQVESTARNLGIENFLTKPILFNNLAAAIREYVPLREVYEVDLLR